VFVQEHYFVTKSFAAVREAFSNTCPDKGPKTTIHRLVTNSRDKQLLIERTAAPTSSFNNGIQLQ
jgi:hypothetical protein